VILPEAEPEFTATLFTLILAFALFLVGVTVIVELAFATEAV
jgi:hypothetical protein